MSKSSSVRSGRARRRWRRWETNGKPRPGETAAEGGGAATGREIYESTYTVSRGYSEERAIERP